MAVNIKQKRLPRLILPYGMRGDIAKAVGCTPATVHNAINGRITGKKSIAARRLAELKLKEINSL